MRLRRLSVRQLADSRGDFLAPPRRGENGSHYLKNTGHAKRGFEDSL